jgi:hypothetical protein
MRTFARRSSAVSLTLMSGIASAVLVACRNDSRQCVDANDRAVADSLCARQEAGQRPGGGVAGSGSAIGPMWFPYRYYYGGAIVGGLMRGGSYTPRAGRWGSGSSGARAANGGTSRGGFGGIGSGRGFGGG